MTPKTFLLAGLMVVVLGFIFSAGPALATSENPDSAGSNASQIMLPPAGWTPNSPFYFLERAAEAIEEFFAFSPEARAKLQAERALERIAEVRAMLAEKETNPKGIDIALSRLQANVIKAASIVQSEQQKGKEVSPLAKKLDTDFETSKRLLKQTFKQKGDQIELAFKQQKFKLKKQLIDAKLAGDAQKVGEIVLAIDRLEQEKEARELLLKQQEKEFESLAETEEEKFEQALDEKERALEQKEKEAEALFEQKRQTLEKTLKEIEQALELKEEYLEDQLDIALSLGDAQSLEQIKAQLLAIEAEQAALEAKSEESEKALKEVEQNFEALLTEKNRSPKDFERQEELISEKADSEIEKTLKQKETALESQLEAREQALELEREKQAQELELQEEQSERQKEEPEQIIKQKEAKEQESAEKKEPNKHEQEKAKGREAEEQD